MRLEDLGVFRTVHDTGSFQRAAHRVGLSQSAVTKVVRRLEDGDQLGAFGQAFEVEGDFVEAKTIADAAEALEG